MSDYFEIKKVRLIIFYIFIILAFILVTIRLLYIVSFGDQQEISNIYKKDTSITRGDIYDRNGVLVATDLKTKALFASSILIKNPKYIASALEKIFPESNHKEFYKKITSKSARWILIKRNLSPLQARQIRNLKIAGLVFEDDLVRIYPQKASASHIIGNVDPDRNGISGIEKQYDDVLKSGEDVHLAMDLRSQDLLSNELKHAIKNYNAKAAIGVIMDVTNGEVIAASSIPDYDLNLQAQASPNQKFTRFINGVYEFGSIFKIFTNTIAFEDNLTTLGEQFNVKNPIIYGRFTINDDHHYKDILTTKEVFSYSSNIGTIEIAKKFGAERQKEFFKDMNLLDKVEVDFPGFGRPIYPKTWREINLFTIAYGHGIAINPLHLCYAITGVVNGGKLYNPSFKKITGEQKYKRIVKESTSKIIREMLRDVAVNGTGKFANIAGYEVGGKTGTAERAEYGSYNKSLTLASFIATFPTSKPKYVLYVGIDQPNYTFNTGGMVAAPVAGRIIERIAPILEIPAIQNITETIQ